MNAFQNINTSILRHAYDLALIEWNDMYEGSSLDIYGYNLRMYLNKLELELKLRGEWHENVSPTDPSEDGRPHRAN